MSSPNDFIKVHVNNTTCFCSTQCRNQAVEAIVRGTSERLICREYHRLNDIENQHLDQMWQVTLNRITTGVALYYSATRRAGLTSFGPSMAGEPEYFALPQRERTKLCKNERTNERTNERKNERTNERTNVNIFSSSSSFLLTSSWWGVRIPANLWTISRGPCLVFWSSGVTCSFSHSASLCLLWSI